MSIASGPNVVSNSLVLELDAANPKSYSPNIAKNALDIYGWTVGTNGSCTIARDTTDPSPVNGIACKMTITGNDPYMATYQSTTWTLGPAKAGETWTVSVWAKSSVASGYTQMFIFGVDNTGTYNNLGGVGGTDFGAGNNNFTAANVWVRHSFSYTFSNANVTGIQIRLDGTDSGAVGQIIWFDGLQLEKSSSMTTFNQITNTTGINWYDASGTTNNGTLINTPVYSTNNLGYITYDGSTSYTSIPNSSSLQVADTFTINSWVYPTSLSNRFGIFSTRTVNSTGCWQLEVGTGSGGQGRVAVTGIGTWIWESSDNVITTNTWYNICFVKPNNATQGGSMYLNGVLLTPATTTAYTISNNSDAKGVAVGTNSTQYFPGRVSSVSLYNTALSAQQVAQNFNAIKGRYGI